MTDDQSRPEEQSEESIRQDERRRIAQDIHDSTSQTLIVLQLGLGRLRRQGGAELRPIIDEIEETIAAIRAEVRAAASGARREEETGRNPA